MDVQLLLLFIASDGIDMTLPIPSRPSRGVDQMRQAVTSLFQGREIADFVAAPSDLGCSSCLSHVSPRFPRFKIVKLSNCTQKQLQMDKR